jgi:hypothetical protein
MTELELFLLGMVVMAVVSMILLRARDVFR